MHRYSWRCIQTIEMGFTDDKDVSRTIRMGFMDSIVVSHNTKQLTEDAFPRTKVYVRGTWLGFCSCTFCNSM